MIDDIAYLCMFNREELKHVFASKEPPSVIYTYLSCFKARYPGSPIQLSGRMVRPALHRLICMIVLVCAEKEVRRVATWGIITAVKYACAMISRRFRYGTISEDQRDFARSRRIATPSDAAVSMTAYRALPFPAFIWLPYFDVRPKFLCSFHPSLPLEHHAGHSELDVNADRRH